MDFIKKVIKGIVGFFVSSAALVALYFCDMIAIGIALSVQNKIPAIEKAAKTHGSIEYVLPALAVFLISLVFVKINKKHFHLTLGKIILRYIALMVFLVGSVVLLAFLCSFVWNLIPEDTKTTIINVVSLPLVFLTVFSHGTFFFAAIPIIIAAFVLCLVVPLSLMAGFAAASFYEKRSRIFKILLKITAVVSLVLFVGHLVKVGTTITDDDVFNRTYTTKKDAAFLEKLHEQGFDFEGKKMLPYLVKYTDAPDFILEQVISYGVDVRACSEECFESINFKKARFLLEHGADPNVRDTFDGKPFLFEALEDYDTLKSVLEHGADPNIKFETTSCFISGTGDSYKVTQNAGMYYFDTLKYQRNKEGYRDIIKLLREYGMDMKYKDEKGMTVLDYANHFGSPLSYEISKTINKEPERYCITVKKDGKSWIFEVPIYHDSRFLSFMSDYFIETEEDFIIYFYSSYNYFFHFKEIDGEPYLYKIQRNKSKTKEITPNIKMSDLNHEKIYKLMTSIE